MSESLVLSGLIKRPADAVKKQRRGRWVEPWVDLPDEAKRKMRKLDDDALNELVLKLKGSPFFANVVEYAKVVQFNRVPADQRIVCARCKAVYLRWTRWDKEEEEGRPLKDYWKHLEYGLRKPDKDGWDTAYRTLCPNCITLKDTLEDRRCKAKTEKQLADYRAEQAQKVLKGKTDE